MKWIWLVMMSMLMSMLMLMLMSTTVVNLYSSGFGVLGWYWPDLIGPLCQDGPLRSHYSWNYLNMPILVISNITYLIKNIVGKSVKNSTGRKFTRRDSSDAIILNLPRSSNTIEKMFSHPSSLHGFYSSIDHRICQFWQLNAKRAKLVCTLAKN